MPCDESRNYTAIMTRTSNQRRRLLKLLPMVPLFLRSTTFAVQAEAKSWPGIEFTEARAYAWPAELAPDKVVRKDNTLLPGVANPAGALLSEAQVKRLQAAVTGGHRSYSVARCHIPRHAVVFYDKDKKPVAFLEICLDCKSRRAEPAVAEHLDLGTIADLLTELKLPLGNFTDAEAFKKSISFTS